MERHDNLSRRAFVRRAGAAGLSLGALPALLSACGDVKGEEQTRRAASPASAHHPKVPIRDLVWSSYPLYIDKSVLRSFDQKFGAHVDYIEDVNDNFAFFGKVRDQLSQGEPIGRDLVVLADFMAARWVRNGYLTPIDKANVPNAANLQDDLRHPKWDPQRDYTLPWQSGATGIGYNPKKTGRKLHSVNDLFDPAFKGRVTFVSEPYDATGLVLLGMGIDSTEAKLDDIMKAIDKIDEAQRSGQLRRFTGNDYTADLANGNTWVAMAYSGDVVQLQSDNPDLEFLFPDEGVVFWSDNMMIPAKAEHPYAAETMMNYVYEPEVAAKIAEYVNYISPVKGIEEYVSPKLRENPLIFPTPELRKKFHPYPTLSPDDERAMEDRFQQVMGG